jgi:DNA gyrase subunit B
MPSAASRTQARQEGPDYDASQLKVLRGLEPVRKRPGMYVASRDGRGIAHLVWELVDNGADEAQAGHADHIVLEMGPDGSIEVTDNGRGIPVDIEPTSGLSGLELVLSTLHAGGKFGGEVYGYSGGLHGVGVSVVCALASRLEAQVWREKEGSFTIAYEQGKLVQPMRKRPGSKAHPHGTRIKFWPDPEIFGDAVVDFDAVLERCRSKAYLIPGLRVDVIDRRQDPPTKETYTSKKGLVDLLEHLATNPLHRPIVIEGEGTYEETVQVLGDQGISAQTMERTGRLELAMVWTGGYDTTVQLAVNQVTTPRGGTHLTGLNQALSRVVTKAVEGSRVKKIRDPSPNKDDVLEGLTLVLHLQIPEPQFNGQAKEELGTPQAHQLVYQIVARELADWFEQAPRTQVRVVLEKVMAAARARDAARKSREMARKKDRNQVLALPAKLSDSHQHYPDESELLIVEGDSAAGPARAGRDQRFQAVLPIRGKILNAARASAHDLAGNAEVTAIFAALGIQPGPKADPEQRRYARVVIMPDADADGFHIRCLLLSLFYYQAPALLENGAVWVAMPPLYTLRVLGQADTYTYSDQERDAALAKMRTKNVQILRFKGLGEMDVEELCTTCLDPHTRQLMQVQIRDAEATASMFEQLMGDDAALRRDFIVQHSEMVDPLALDL